MEYDEQFCKDFVSKVLVVCCFQGLEIVNPQAAEKKVQTSQKYFSNTAGFMQMGGTPTPRGTAKQTVNVGQC